MVWKQRTPRLFALLADLAPQLRELEHWYPTQAPASPASALPAQLGRLSQLTSLELNMGKTRVTTAQVDAVVQGMPSLQHLRLEADTWGALADGFPVSVATCCSRLRHLSFRRVAVGAVPPELGRLTALTRLALTDSQLTCLPESISRLTALKELGVAWNQNLSLPLGLSACRQLARLAAVGTSESPVLARLQSLRALTIGLGPVQPRDEHWTRLTALTELSLWCRRSIPPGLSGMTGLRNLSIYDAVLVDVPGGPYLNRLASLEMEDCVFEAGVPASLAAASQLRDLSLDGNRGINVTAADVATLSTLPALVTLSLGKPEHMVQHVWDGRLARLRAAYYFSGRSVPPAICG